MHHQNGKEDSPGSEGRGGEANEASSPNAFNSNTFPLLSRSSMKRPFSLSSEREPQSPTIKDHFCTRGFRSRSKTVHSDTFARPAQYCDLFGQSNNLLTGLSSVNSKNSITDRSAITRYLEQNRRKPSSTRGSSGGDKKSHLVIPEHILDEDMAVDDDEEDDGQEQEEDGQLTMLLNTEQNLPPSEIDPGQRKQATSLDIYKGSHHHLQNIHPHTEKPKHSWHPAKLDLVNSNPAAALFTNAKSKMNFSLGSSTMQHISSGQLMGQTRNLNNLDNYRNTSHSLSESFIDSKVAITFPSKPTCTASTDECDETSDCLLASRASKFSPEKKATLDDGQQPLNSSSEGPASQFTIQNSLSTLAVPKSATPFLDSKTSTALVPFVASIPAHIPTEAEKAQFQRSLDSATTLVFHRRSGLPLTSSPAPIRKCGTCFDFDSSLTSVNAIKKALFEKDTRRSVSKLRSRVSFSAPTTTSALLGNFEESVLNGRLEPASIVNGFTAEIGASGTFCPKHKTLPVTVFFYTLQDSDKAEKISSPYLGHINLGPKGYHVPRQGTVQVTLFNPNGTVVKMFVVRYDLSDMPPNSRTFLRQRTLFMPSDASEHHADNRKWLRYLIHLRFQSSKSGRIRLHTDIRILVFRKHDLDVATLNGGVPYELRSFIQMPSNPKYSKNIKS